MIAFLIHEQFNDDLLLFLIAPKGKSKAKKPSIDADSAEGIVNFDNLQNRMEDALSELSQNFAAKIPARINSGTKNLILP